MLVVEPNSLNMLNVNQAALAQYGYTREEFLRLKLGDIHASEYSGEQRHLLKSGEFIDMEVIAHPFEYREQKTILLTMIDITPHKQAEQKLRESEEMLRITLENISDPVFITDEDGNFTFICPNVAHNLRYSVEEIQAMGNIAALLGQAAHIPQMQGEFSNIEKTLLDKQGRRRNFLVNKKRVSIGQGTHLYTLRDITERKQAEAALQKNTSTAERYLNIAAEIIVSLDSEGNITLLNESGYHLLGYKSGLIGKNWFETCIPEKERESVRRLFEMMKRDEIQPSEASENNIITSSGEEKTILWHNTILKDEEERFIGTLSSGEDITNRIETEKALRIALAKYKTLFECFPLGITITNEAGGILETNPTAEKLLSVPRDEHSQRAIDGTEWSIIRPNRTPMPPDEFASVRALKENRLVENVEMGIVKTDKSISWISVNAAPLPLEGHGVVVTYGDITARKRAENILQARMRLSQFAETHTLDELLQQTLDEAEVLTESEIGFAHFLQADQRTLELQMWSTNTLKNMCAAEGKGRHYPIDRAGVWVDCIYARAPIIHNDYKSLSHRKGLPPGHAPIVRELVTPVIRSGNIVAIFGMGNKHSNYTSDDVDAVLELANLTWDTIQRKRAEDALRISEKKYRLLHESMIDGFVKVDMEGHIVEHNHVYRDMLGYSEAELGLLTYKDITPGQWHDYETRIIRDQILKRGYSDIYEKEYRRKDGSTFPVELHTVLLRNEQGEPAGMWAIVRDITQRKRVEKELQESENRFRTTLQEVQSIAVQGYTTDGIIQYWNNASESLYGYSASEAIGKNLLELIIPPEIQDEVQRDVKRMAESGHPIPMAELSLMRKDGSRVSVYSSHVIVPRPGKTPELFCLDVDLTQRKQAEKELEAANAELQAALIREKELAHTDMLTGVNNRRNLYELAAHELDIARRYRQPLSLLMFDLDHFKQVNDTFGHAVGDQILVQVTQAARAELRSADTIGRYGGEEFAILLPITTAQQAFSLAERIRESVAQTRVTTPLGEAAVTLSIGIVELQSQTGEDETVDDLIRRADQAMYAAKQSGRNRTTIFGMERKE